MTLEYVYLAQWLCDCNDMKDRMIVHGGAYCSRYC
jgi:hypothetical protein